MSQPARTQQLRRTLAERLARARSVTDSLFELLNPDALLSRPIRERHRVLFYVGHLEAFDWNLLGRETFDIDPFDEHFDSLFAFGIDPTDGSLPDDAPSDWPSPSEVRGYVRRVREDTDRLLKETSFEGSDKLIDGKVFEVAIEHRLMHAETLAYMLHWLPFSEKRPSTSRPRLVDPQPPEITPVVVPEGTATLGLARETGVFGWDNEFEVMRTDVPAFAIDTRDVSNRQFLEFVVSGGYDQRSLWSEDGWKWRCEKSITHPRFWKFEHGKWMQRTMFELRPLPGSWPVYVSQAEAAAYARWAGRSLPTEAQLHRAAYGTPEGTERPFPWGSEPPDATRGNFDFQRWDPVPVGSYPKGNSAFGIADLLGNGWEWTSTLFEPFEGFERFDFYPGYSADFFDQNHFVLKGGSGQTSACMLRRSFRNWFQPHYPNIYATFRCVHP